MRKSAERTELFYLWERKLRGWDVFEHPIDPELRFAPCLQKHLHLFNPPDKVDDGRHATWLSGFADIFRGSKPAEEVAPQSEIELRLPEPKPTSGPDEVVEFHLLLPQEYRTKHTLMQQILVTLAFVRYPISFEVIGSQEEIVVVLACSGLDAPQVYDQLTAFAPECVIDQTTHYLAQKWTASGCPSVVDFGLEHEVMLPLHLSTSDHDPLIGVMGALSSLRDRECGLLQVLFRLASPDWSNALRDAVTDHDGSSFFADAPHIKTQAEQKVALPLCACVIRVAASASNPSRCHEIVRAIGGTLMQFRSTSSNGYIPLDNESYDDDVHNRDVLLRTTHRAGALLNIAELTALVHFPDALVRIPKLKRQTKLTKQSPQLTAGNGISLGVNKHHGEFNHVRLNPQHRLRHMHLIGASGTGKSTMMLNMIIQDMEAGNGVAVLDPHGDLIDTLLGYVPDDRIDDVIVFDPSDEEYPIGFNIIDAHSELEKTLLASDLTSVFRRLSTSWGDQMNSVLANGIAAMLESTQGGTLPILRRFLVDQSFRKEFLTTVTDPENVFYWEREFPLLSGKPQGPVLTRLDTFLRPKPIRHMVAQKENKIDFADIMQSRKIFLAKLSQGSIGTENSYLMGALLVTKMNQIAYSRQAIDQKNRRDFYLYIDEFHNFITPSMESILSGARKFNLALVLAHQELRQIESKDANVAASVMSNPYTRVCFRLGDSDAKRLQSGFSFFEAKDLLSLGIGDAIVRVERSEYDFNLSAPPLPEIDESYAENKAKEIISCSRLKYGMPREKVEQFINESLQVGSVTSPSKSKVVSKKAEKKKPDAEVSEPAPKTEKLQGRGGKKHKELQKFVKDLAEDNGFKATIEKRINNGSGHVDVVLERDSLKIACEISVTTSVAHEIANIEKCLEAGYTKILFVSDDVANLNAIKDGTKHLFVKGGSQCSYIDSDGIEQYFEQYVNLEFARLYGYDVESQYGELSPKEKAAKKKRIHKLLFDSLTSPKDGNEISKD